MWVCVHKHGCCYPGKAQQSWTPTCPLRYPCSLGVLPAGENSRASALTRQSLEQPAEDTVAGSVPQDPPRSQVMAQSLKLGIIVLTSEQTEVDLGSCATQLLQLRHLHDYGDVALRQHG